MIKFWIYLGFRELWRKRRQLALCQPAEADRLLGNLLILSGSAIFLLFLSSVSLQALLCLEIWIAWLGSLWFQALGQAAVAQRSHQATLCPNSSIKKSMKHLTLAG